MITTILLGIAALSSLSQSSIQSQERAYAPMVSMPSRLVDLRKVAFAVIDGKGPILNYRGRTYKFSQYVRPELGYGSSPVSAKSLEISKILGDDPYKDSEYEPMPTVPGNYIACIVPSDWNTLHESGGPILTTEWVPVFSDAKNEPICVMMWFKAAQLPKVTPAAGDASIDEVFKDIDWSDKYSVARLACSVQGEEYPSDHIPGLASVRAAGHTDWASIFNQKAVGASDAIQALCALGESGLGIDNAYLTSLLPMARDAVIHPDFWLQPSLLRFGQGTLKDYPNAFKTYAWQSWSLSLIDLAPQIKSFVLSNNILYYSSYTEAYCTKSQAMRLLDYHSSDNDPFQFLRFMDYLNLAFPKIEAPGIYGVDTLPFAGDGDPRFDSPLPEPLKFFQTSEQRHNCIQAWKTALARNP